MLVKTLTYINGKAHWIEQILSPSKGIEKDPMGLTVDQLINRDGGILNHADNKIYTTKVSYLQAVKNSGCYIK